MKQAANTSDQPIRVLLFEDNDGDYLLATRHLSRCESQRFDIERTERMDKGLALLREGDFDVVLLDLGLPDSFGWNTLDVVRTAAGETPIVVLTGLSDETMGVEALRHGAQDYLPKEEIGTQPLVRAIRYAIERRKVAEFSRANEMLQAAVRKLEGYERARAEFIDNVSHELRTPLATMSYTMSNLLKGILGQLPEKLRTYLVMFEEECERLKATVVDILDMGRIDEQMLELHRVKVPFSSWAHRVSTKLRSKADAKHVTLSLAGLGIPGFADADPLKLERVMVSVTRNAIYYTPEGGHVELDVHPARDGRWIELSVTDDGVGIPPEHLPKVTQRYYRVGELVTGTGLGLTLCKELLERQGGEIELLSPPPGRNAGTQVRIRLPLASAPTVLAVDDSKTIQALLDHHLKSHGYSTVICGSAEQALEHLEKSRPDMLIVDAVLPGMDGVDLVARVKSDHDLRHLPIIMITGAEVDGARRGILEEFRIPILGKPWVEDELIACLEDAIYGKFYLQR
jgi:signal transduction histidine kinase